MHISNPNSLDQILSADPTWSANRTKDELVEYIFNRTKSIFGLTTSSVCLCVFLGLLFVFGLVGNLWVISVVVYIMKTLRNAIPNQNIFVYILCLSAVDSFVLMIVPMLISDILFYRWIFGPILCKIYYIIESSNKLLSTFLLAALSCDRFLAVCHPNVAYKIRTTRNTAICVTCLFVFVTVLLAPLHYSSSEMSYDEYIDIGNVTVMVGMPKCSLAMTNQLMTVFTVYMFIVGFCIPGALITYFYARVLRRIYSHAKAFGDNQTHIPVRRVTIATLMVILFYFACWTPYWGLTIYLLVTPIDGGGNQQQAPETISSLNSATSAAITSSSSLASVATFGVAANNNASNAVSNEMNELGNVLVSYVFHSLVYVNSALNWVFYALLNKHLRESHDAAVERNRSNSLSRNCRTMGSPTQGDSPQSESWQPPFPLKQLMRIRLDSKSSTSSSCHCSVVKTTAACRDRNGQWGAGEHLL